MSDEVAFRRWLSAMHKADRKVARALGIPLPALQMLVGICARQDGSVVVASGWGRKPRLPNGFRAALRAGLVERAAVSGFGPAMWLEAPITPTGREAIWRHHEAQAAVPPRSSSVWASLPDVVSP